MRAHTNNPKPIEEAEGGITLEAFLLLLDKVQKHGPNYLARCPAHDDGRPSLRVAQGERGILVNCYAGCSYNEIVKALGLRPQDLFTDALTEKSRDEYRYRAVLREIQKLEITVWQCEHDMKQGRMTESDMEYYREKIQELINRRNERDDLRRKHGFPKND